jgi:hypothetical protein
LAKSTELKPEEISARHYVDRLILRHLTELREVVKPSELADRLKDQGVSLAVVRSLLASNDHKFAYNERRWVPASRVVASERPLNEFIRDIVQRFGGPMPIDLLVDEVANTRAILRENVERVVRRTARADAKIFLTTRDEVAYSDWVFVAHDEPPERMYALNEVDEKEVEKLSKQLKDIDWFRPGAAEDALKKVSPISLKLLGAVAWTQLSPYNHKVEPLYNWRELNSEILGVDGFVYSPDGNIYPEDEAKKWISTTVKVADKLTPTIEVEDAAPLELKKEDIEAIVAKINDQSETVTATTILEELFEITPVVKTFPDDLDNVMNVLKKDKRVWWVGGDRFRNPNSAPDFIYELPEAFDFVKSDKRDDEGELIDAELTEEGLSSSLRKLLVHPLAVDVKDEEIMPELKNQPDQLRLVLKPIHRELGTFPLAPAPTGWFDSEPEIQELIFMDKDGRELQVWLNMKARLMFNLLDWWLDQPVESGAVFSLTKTNKPNVFEFEWFDQTDPIVYISNQRMEELREIEAEAEGKTTFDLLRQVLEHWPKGAEFLSLLWELNVVRRTSRTLLASLLSSYACFYQRSGSPVWHYDAKKVEQGFDKTKRKFMKKE